MLAIIPSGAIQAVTGCSVQVEVNTGEIGELRLILVGLPDTAVKESQDRVFSALTNSGFSPPATRTTINLAPGNLRKEGPMYDLPIAIGILAATHQLPTTQLQDYLVAGELSLSGETRPIKGGLALAILAKKEGKKGILLPKQTAKEASLVDGIAVYPIESLNQAVQFLSGKTTIQPLASQLNTFQQPKTSSQGPDFSEIKGQHALKRAVEVAVAGGHNILIIGPPGSGKSMVAKRIPTIMPEPLLEEFLEILGIHSVAGITLSQDQHAFQRPFRSPHHTISDVGLLGGGAIPGPGEISLAHHGVLFLDELPEFKRSTLEVLRQPLEDGSVTISRSAGKITLPCAMMLVAAMNPCPCGYMGDHQRKCRCTHIQIQRYRSKISGPLLDRIDIHIEAPALSVHELRTTQPGETSSTIRNRVYQARLVQKERFHQSLSTCNARMTHQQLSQHCKLEPQEGSILQKAMEQLGLSARAYDRVLKVARTIADLDRNPTIQLPHLLEAIQYRSLDRNLF